MHSEREYLEDLIFTVEAPMGYMQQLSINCVNLTSVLNLMLRSTFFYFSVQCHGLCRSLLYIGYFRVASGFLHVPAPQDGQGQVYGSVGRALPSENCTTRKQTDKDTLTDRQITRYINTGVHAGTQKRETDRQIRGCTQRTRADRVAGYVQDRNEPKISRAHKISMLPLTATHRRRPF